MPGSLKVCICGGGSGAHVLACLAASKPDTEVSVLTLFKDEAEKWSKAIENEPMVVNFNKDGRQSQIKAAPGMVSKDPAAVVPGCDLLVLVVPAFAHEAYLKAVIPHLNDRCVIIGLPGKPGFEYQCMSLLGEKSKVITVMNFESLPWACKFVEYGKSADVYGTNRQLTGSILRGKAIPRKPPLMSLQILLGFEPMLSQARHYLDVLFTPFSFMDAVIIYGRWRNWNDKPVSEEDTLFYAGVDQETAEILEKFSMEMTDVAHAITAQHPALDLTQSPDVFNWYLSFYKDQIEDTSSLHNAITSNSFNKERVHQVTKLNTRFKPDFKTSVLTEELPMGLLVLKGVAEILEVPIPLFDMVIDWAQEKLGKQYLVEGKMTGKDMSSARCPQNYGITTLADLLKGFNNSD